MKGHYHVHEDVLEEQNRKTDIYDVLVLIVAPILFTLMIPIVLYDYYNNK